MSVYFLIAEGAFTGDQFKIFIETSEIIKSTLETDLLTIQVILDEELTGVLYAQFEEKAGIGLLGPRFKKAAEGIGADVSHGGNLFQEDSTAEMAQAIVVDAKNAFMAGVRPSAMSASGLTEIL